ncbi:MAG: ATP-binding protein [Chloroflexi bacterium]|nr:ATP-binding protein [Chloroflexota bacterium]
MQAIIFTGIQASGKSSFYKEHFFKTHIRINLDMLKTRHREKLLVTACIEAKQPFVVDNTNATREIRARYIIPARQAGFEIVGYYFPSRIDDALRRNETRTGTEHIPEMGIRGTHSRLEIPTFDEGYDKLYYVRIESDGFVVEAWDFCKPNH